MGQDSCIVRLPVPVNIGYNYLFDPTNDSRKHGGYLFAASENINWSLLEI